MITDAQLLLDYTRNNSQEAFAELVRRHLPLVYRSALRQLNFDQHRAEDVAQMVFAALARQANALTRHTHLPGWLYKTTHHTACQVLRDETRRRKREQESWLMQSTPTNDNADAPWKQIASVLDDALRSLTSNDREIVLQRFFGNQSFGEVGSVLHIGEDAARMRVARALEKLRAVLKRRGVTTTAASLSTMLASDTALGAPTGLAQTIAATTAQLTPAAASLTATILSIMATSKIAALTTAAAVVALSLATHQSHAARTTQTSLEHAQAELVTLQGRVAEAEKQSSTPRQTARASRPLTLDEEFEAERARGDRFLAAHPEVREALARSVRSRIRGRYLSLYHRLRLTEAQIEQFETLMSFSGTAWPGAGALHLEEAMTTDEHNRQLKALLGNDGFSYYRFCFLRNGPSAQQLAESLALTTEPLTSAQGTALDEILTRIQPDGLATGEIWTLALPELRTVLTPQQMEDISYLYLNAQYDQERSAGWKNGSPGKIRRRTR